MQKDEEKKLFDLYAQFLMVSTSKISNTTLSSLLDNEISHDKFTRMLSGRRFESSELWRLNKKYVRSIEQEDSFLIIDDHIEEKPYMDENDLICWHYDHTVGRAIKGINQLSMVYYSGEHTIPVGFRFVEKTEKEIDKKTNKEKRVSKINKNEHFRNLLREAQLHQIKYKYILCDSWYSSDENMAFIENKLKKYFVMPIKDNRNIALSENDRQNGVYQHLIDLNLSDNQLAKIWLEGILFPLHVIKKVFKNKDNSEGCLYLITNDLNIDSTQIFEIYKKRWKVEEHHKTIKSNLNYGKSPAHTPKTQANHCVLVLYASTLWEKLSKNVGLNHFALKAKLYLKAIKSAWNELLLLKSNIIQTNNCA